MQFGVVLLLTGHMFSLPVQIVVLPEFVILEVATKEGEAVVVVEAVIGGDDVVFASSVGQGEVIDVGPLPRFEQLLVVNCLVEAFVE